MIEPQQNHLYLKYLAAIQDPMMCADCAEILIKCFNFKMACVYAHKCIFVFFNKRKDTVKVDLKDVYLNKNRACAGISEDQDVCRFCLSLVKKCSIVSLDVENNMLEKMTKECLPELTAYPISNIIKKSVICQFCYGSLEMFFHFVTKCLTVEEKINTYCETLDVDKKNQTELSSLLQAMIRDATTREVDRESIDIIKVERQFCEGRQNADENEIGQGSDTFKLEEMSCDDSKHVKEDVEHKDESYVDATNVKFNNDAPENMLASEEDTDNPGVIKVEEICEGNEVKMENVERGDQNFLPNEEIEIKTDGSDFYRTEDDVVSPQLEDSISLCRRRHCLESDLEGDPSIPHTTHTSTKEHDLQTRDNQNECCWFQCEFCSFRTNTIRYLKKHLLVHKDPSQVMMHKCDLCTFQTKYAVSMRNHLLIRHKDPLEVTMYTCESCTFQTKSVKNLKSHSLAHKDASEVAMYECGSCSFQTKYRASLKKHLLMHKDPSQVEMHKCDSCSFQSKYKVSLKKHSFTHKDQSELIMYKCDCCTFETKYKYDLKKHVQSHKDPTYKCDSCSFKTTSGKYLKRHLLTHKNPSEVTVYKCDSCSFQAIHKEYLSKHVLRHRDPLKVTMYKCHSCSFQTKSNYSLKHHSLKHRDPLEIKLYKCKFCKFQTKRDGYLQRHLLLHKDRSEITTYKCCLCPFQTRIKQYLTHHESIHKNVQQ